MQFNGKTFRAEYWMPSDGPIGPVVAFDCETSPATRDSAPPFVLGTAYGNGDIVWMIQLDYLKAFFLANPSTVWVAHNAPFDISVIEQEIGLSFDSQIRNQRFFDTGLLYILWKLATVGESPHRWSLDLVVDELIGVQLNKDDNIRLDYGRFRRGGVVYYDEITPEHIQYAATDAIATFQIYEILRAKIDVLPTTTCLSHKLQLMGAYALHRIQMRGIGFDLAKRESFLESVESDINSALTDLAHYEYYPKSPWESDEDKKERRTRLGLNKQYELAIANSGIPLPFTKTGCISSRREDLEKYRNEHPFVDAYLKFKESMKLRDFVVNLDSSRIHTRFRCILDTGRTSSSDPNLQNLPRKPGIRECFAPGPGFVFLIIDYKQIELASLAQNCIDRFGTSQMALLINEGADLHTKTAAVITGKIECDVTSAERSKAKAVNFGFPGGLGPLAFVDYARLSYGINDMTSDDAEVFKEKWFDAYPEMRSYLADTLEDRLDTSGLPWCTDIGMAVGIFKRVVSGKTESLAGNPYKPATINWVFRDALPQIAPKLLGVTTGSLELLEKISRESVTTRTGRIRAQATYCQARNTPFQGLAADGAKIALYRLERQGYRTVNFIHDELILEIPEGIDYEQVGNDVKRICVDAMRCVIPDVKVDAEWCIADRWYKSAKLARNSQGKIVPYSEN